MTTTKNNNFDELIQSKGDFKTRFEGKTFSINYKEGVLGIIRQKSTPIIKDEDKKIKIQDSIDFEKLRQ